MYSKKINQLATNLNPQNTDLLPIGDAETGQLKTTTFGSVSGVTGDGVISGGIVTWTGTGLIFNISACTYILNGIRYSSPESTKTLATADPTNPRIDVFAVNTSSQVEVIQGTPASNPVEPEGDTPTTLGLTNVTINAGATTPNNVTRDLIYDENVESWTKTISQSSSTYNLADTAFAYTGSKSILATMGAGFIYFNFSKAVAMDISNYKSLSFAIRLNTAWTSNTILSVRFLNGTNSVTNLFQINSSNNVGFNRNLSGQWQLITIPFNNTNLKFTNNAFTTIRIATQNAAVTYRLDTIQLNGGINNPTGGSTTPSNSFGFVNGSTGTASSTTATDTLNVVGTGLATTSATGKTLTIAVPTPIPSQTGNTGKFLTTDGSVVSWGTPTDTGITSLNGLGATTQTFATGTSGTDFGISSATSIHTFNLPTASATNRGALSSADWSTFNGKQGALTLTTTGTSGAATLVGNTLNIPQYSGGGGMAIGGSITSATAGSILFAGTSGILQQDNSNFFWDDTNNRLGIGTNTPLFDLHISRNNNGVTRQVIENTTSGTASRVIIQLTSDSSAGSVSLGKASTTFTAFKTLNSQDGYIYNGGAGDISILNDVPTTGKIKFAAGGSSTAQMTLTAAGRLLLGTTTESTFILDVTGTSRITGNSTFGGTISVTGNTTFSSNSTFGTLGSGTGMYWDNTNNRLGIGTGSPSYRLDVIGTTSLSGSTLITGSTTASSAIARGAFVTSTLVAAANNDFLVALDIAPTFTNGGFTVNNYLFRAIASGVTRTFINSNGAQEWFLASSGTERGKIAYSTPGNFPGIIMYTGSTYDQNRFNIVNRETYFSFGYNVADYSLNIFNTSGNVGINTTTDVASAQLHITSTTKGFLPPRMTTTQKNAIATPAAGLVVYDTTTNKLCCYNGTTWNDLF